MNTNKLEAMGATFATFFTLGADKIAELNGVLQLLLTLANLAWWFRIWLKNPNQPPPGASPAAGKSQPGKSRPGISEAVMLLFLLVPVVFLVGCSSLDARVEEAQDVKTTHVRIRTFWDAKSELAKMHTTSTDKTQSVSVSGLQQESSGSNAVSLVESAVSAAVSAAVKSAK